MLNLRILCKAVVFSALVTSCSQNFQVDRSTVENAHGLKLPKSASNLQQRSFGALADRGIASFVEIDRPDVEEFVSQLKVRSKHKPAKPGPGDPRINGYNVWPERTPTFVPGNIGKMNRTWRTSPSPVELLSCDSPKGDWLHVEIWSVGNRALVKLYTDWN